MAMTPTYALAHVFVPNLLKSKGVATVVGVIERKEKFFFDALWNQAHVEHQPFLFAQVRDPYRIGVISLPPPKEMGEAFMIGLVTKATDQSFGKYYLLEHDYVLAKQADRTMITERDGTRHVKHFEGPALTGDETADAIAFIDGFMELLVPTKVTPKPERSW